MSPRPPALALSVFVVLMSLLCMAVPARADQVRMAVLEFAAQPGTQADWEPLGKGFQEMILVDLSKASTVDVVERRAVREQRLLLGWALPGSTDERRSLGQRSGATHVLSGGFSVVGNTLTLTTELLAVGTGEVLLARSVEGEAEAFFELEKEVVQASIGALQLSLSARERAETSRLHTADFLAFQDFSHGLDDFDAERYEASLRSLRRATERDAQFSLASITLDQYTELITRVRAKADAIQVVKAEQARLDKLSEAGEEVEVLRKLLTLARQEGDAHVRARMTALHTLAMAYGNEGRNRSKLRALRDREDRFAMQRASDELWEQYHREALTLWPKLPLQVDDTFYAGFPALETFDEDFAKAEQRLWEHGADYPDNRIKYLQDSLRYPYNTGLRIHLSLRDEVALHDTFFELARQLPAADYWYKGEIDQLLKSYPQVLRFDDSTRLLERRADETENEFALRGIASQIEDNKAWSQALRKAADRERVEEWMMIAQADGWSKGPVITQAEEHFSTKGPLDAEGAKMLTSARDWPSADRGWVRLDEVPAWCHQHCYWVWSGPRSDARVTSSVRFYKEDDKDPDQEPLLFLDSAPRADIDAGFTVRWTVPDDFAPHGFEKPKADPPAVAFLVRLVDLDVKLYTDPVTDERTLARPLRGIQVRVQRDQISVDAVTEVKRESYERKLLEHEVIKSVRLKKGLPDGARIGLSLRGRTLTVLMDGQVVLTTKIDAEPAGFAGLRMMGLGYVEVSDVVLSGAKQP